MQQGIELQARAVERTHDELKARIGQLRQAPSYLKLHYAHAAVASFYETADHQNRFNLAVVAELEELRRRLEALAPAPAAEGAAHG